MKKENMRHMGRFAADLRMQTSPQSTEPDTRIDYFTFFSVLALLFAVLVPLIMFPKEGADWVEQAKLFITDTFGVFYLLIGVLAVMFVVYISFSDIGNIKLGRPEEEVEFKTASWAAMMFCGGIGASILYWGIIEWAYYYQGPPFNLEPGSPEAIRWATTYGMFHWGTCRLGHLFTACHPDCLFCPCAQLATAQSQPEPDAAHRRKSCDEQLGQAG